MGSTARKNCAGKLAKGLNKVFDEEKLLNKNKEIFWMKNKTMNELGFRIMWRIMQISEDVIHRNIFLHLQNSSSYSVSLNNWVITS